MSYEIYILDLIGTFAFACYGSYIALRKRLDILGVFICAFLTAVGGGTIREIILKHNLFYFNDYNYIFTIGLGVLVSLFVYNHFQKIRRFVMVLDAVGLVAFAFIGASKAADANLGLLAIAFFAVVSSVGGGVIRDIVLGEISEILYKGFYASIAIILGIIYGLFIAYMDNLYYINLLLSFCFVTRIITAYYKINLWSPFRKPQKRLVES